MCSFKSRETIPLKYLVFLVAYTVPVYENLHPPRWFSTRRPSRGSGRYSPPAQKSQTEKEKSQAEIEKSQNET